MKDTTVRGFFSTIVLLLMLACLPSAEAQQKSSDEATAPAQSVSDKQDSPQEEAPPTGQVMVDGRPILTVYETVAGNTPDKRARGIEQRIIAIASQRGASVEPSRLEPHEGWTEILVGNQVVLAVTETDAEMQGKSHQGLAAEYAKSIDQAIHDYHQEHSWRMILRGLLKTLLATVIVVPVLWVLRRARFAIRGWIERWIQTLRRPKQKAAWHLATAYIGSIALALGTIIRWVLILAVLEAYLTLTLGFFSSTRQISLTVTKWVFSQVEFLAQSVLNYLPKLMVVAIIAVATWYVTRLIRLVFSEISKGNLKIRGFYPDWAEPTEKLIRMMLIVLALVVAFPYLPGAKTAAFQGISIFVGVLLSLGSSSAVANAIAGIILTYMRSFLEGDWVQINDMTGEVIEKNLLVTRILTPKAEIITIPNATVMSGAVTNYSTEAKKAGVIFHTKVSIGYNTPWRTVHQLLTSAALATEHVLGEPQPFVLQQGLDDFYVSYELNAYTDVPREMLNIYSDLHRNIQDTFNEAQVEICSPHFAAIRDGNGIAIPEQYLKSDYKAPGFHVRVEKTG
jgi:small-conductance mechanosensitive channel